jgi:hypothetical protein
MKSITTILIILIATGIASAQTELKDIHKPDPHQKIMVVETACGKCQLGLKGKSCELAIRINGKAYYVDGTGIDDHGDAHADDGFCNAIRKAEVQGKIVKGRFKATYFKLLPNELKEEKKS